MKTLLTVIAVIEVGAGLGMLAVPSLVGTTLVGSSLSMPVELTCARVAGVGLLALAAACWLARDDGQSRAARGLVAAMLLFNAGVVAVLLYARMGLGLSGTGLWPGVLLHAAVTVWCAILLYSANRQVGGVCMERTTPTGSEE